MGPSPGVGGRSAVRLTARRHSEGLVRFCRERCHEKERQERMTGALTSLPIMLTPCGSTFDCGGLERQKT